MIPGKLVTHTLTATRRGTRTSNAGDTVNSGIFGPTSVIDARCIAEVTAGDVDPRATRERASRTWTVLLDPGLDVRAGDRVTLTPGAVVAMVDEVRPFLKPTSVAHLRLTCLEVTG